MSYAPLALQPFLLSVGTVTTDQKKQVLLILSTFLYPSSTANVAFY